MDKSLLTREDLGLSGKCSPLTSTNGPDRMSPDALKIVRIVMQEVTRGPAGTMPCGQARGGTHGRSPPQMPHLIV